YLTAICTSGPTTTLPCPRISATRLLPSVDASDLPCAVSHQHRRAGGIVRVAAIPHRHANPQKRCRVNDRPHRRLRDAERDHRRRMAVDHRFHVRPRFVDFTMDERSITLRRSFGSIGLESRSYSMMSLADTKAGASERDIR